MKKILILEDRLKRQEGFLEESKLKTDFFEKHNSYIDNIVGMGFKDFSNILNKKEEYKFFLEYSCVIVHRSAFEKEIINRIYTFCRKNKIHLVYFSGGISTTNLQDDNDFSFLTINSKHFYSSNLTLFIEDIIENSNINLGVLAFGKKYEKNILLSISHKLTFNDAVISLKEKCLIQEFLEEYGINNEMLKTNLKEKFIWFDEEYEEPLETIFIVDNVKKYIDMLISEKLKFND